MDSEESIYFVNKKMLTILSGGQGFYYFLLVLFYKKISNLFVK